MKSDTKQSMGSSFLVSPIGLGLLALGLLLSLRMDAVLMAGVCLFFLLLGLVCRYWSARATDNLTLHMECHKTRLFPDQDTVITYEVTNDKLLPLVWMELSQNAPDNACLVPDADFESYEAPYDTDRDNPVSFLRRSFSFIGSFRTLRMESHWHAQRRGLYVIDRLVVRSGDGFGLSQKNRSLPSRDFPVLAVYPRPVEVDMSVFLRPQWDTHIGNRGWMEDNTVLKGNREYQPGDNWKHINWRMTAREQGTPINLYESIQPRAIRFILDGESFCDYEYELESTLEVLAAVLTGLCSAGVGCSLSLPVSRRFPAMTLRADGLDSIDELLLRIAGYDCLMEPDPNTAYTANPPSYLPSQFPADAAPRMGSVYLLTRSGAKLPQHLLKRLRMDRCTILCCSDREAAERMGLQAMELNTLRKGGRP